MAHDPMDHVRDAPYFETSEILHLGWKKVVNGHEVFGIHLPAIFGFQITKFMVLQVVAALAVGLIMTGLSKRMATGEPVRGRFWNFWEAIVMFLRNEIVRPTIGDGHHDHDHGHDDHGSSHDPAHQAHYMAVDEGKIEDPADEAADRMAELGSGLPDDVMAPPAHVEGGPHPADRYLPFIATAFFYILWCNLLGMIPWMGSPTGSLSVTAALAGCAFAATVIYGVKEMGVGGFLKNLCPGGVPLALYPLVWVIEAVGLLIKHGVLAIRLFANLMAGHVVLAVFLLFIAQTANSGLWPVVTGASVFGQVAIGVLELFVAFLQAYIFSFLATLFIASVIHEH